MTKLTADGRYLEEVSIAEFQAGDINIGNVDVTSMPDVTYGGYTYLGEESVTMDGSSKTATLPTGTNFVEISAETKAVRFTLNDAATANSGGYVPIDSTRYTLKIANLTSLALYGEATGVAHLIYRQEP